jgi:hypothetical protein
VHNDRQIANRETRRSLPLAQSYGLAPAPNTFRYSRPRIRRNQLVNVPVEDALVTMKFKRSAQYRLPRPGGYS